MHSRIALLAALFVALTFGCAASPPMIPPPPAGEVAPSPGAASAPTLTPAVTTGERLPEDGEYVEIDELPEVLTKVPPERPADSPGEGTVLIQALVGTDGRVKETRVVKSVPELDTAAVTAVRQWTFRPAKSHGQPVATWVACPVVFQP